MQLQDLADGSTELCINPTAQLLRQPIIVLSLVYAARGPKVWKRNETRSIRAGRMWWALEPFLYYLPAGAVLGWLHGRFFS